MPFVPSFFRRASNSSQDDDLASSAFSYHRYRSDQGAENDVQQTELSNSVNDLSIKSTCTPIHLNLVTCTPRMNDIEKDVESNTTGHEHETKQTQEKVSEAENNTNGKASDDSSRTWWNLLANKDSFESTRNEATRNEVSSAAKEPQMSSAASNYIQKEKILRKKAFNRASLGGSVRFDRTFSDESSTTLPYRYAGAGVGLSKQQDEDIPIDWTPADSSYGAALSAFGCLPKPIRKLAEAVFVILAIATLVYVVMKIGAEISIYTHSSASTRGDLDLDDDDHYEAHM